MADGFAASTVNAADRGHAASTKCATARQKQMKEIAEAASSIGVSVEANDVAFALSCADPVSAALRALYVAVQPQKLTTVDEIREKYRGNEVRLIIALQRKYGGQNRAALPLGALAASLGIRIGNVVAPQTSSLNGGGPGSISASSRPESEAPPPGKWRVCALYGGAMRCCVPARFVDVSDVRPVPDHQEVLADVDSDQSLIFEILARETSVDDTEAGTWFFKDLANANDAGGPGHSTVVEQQLLPETATPRCPQAVARSYVLGEQRVSKFRESDAARNVVETHLVVLRILSVDVDFLVTLSVPVGLADGSSSARMADRGRVAQSPEQRLRASEELAHVLRTFEILDMGLFCS
jgi:hypothetical protein